MPDQISSVSYKEDRPSSSLSRAAGAKAIACMSLRNDINHPHWHCSPGYRPLVARPEANRFLKSLVYVWTFPTSSLALPLIVINSLTGGSTHVHQGVVEVHGRWIRRFLNLGPFQAAALTLGHVVLNQDEMARRLYRQHELVHVCQAERWGPLFVPVYLGLAWRTWRRTGHGYWDHPWEVEAREISGI